MKRETPTVWATSPVNRRHIVDVDEIGPVARCGRWRPDVVPADRGGIECAQCSTMTSPDVFQKADRKCKARKKKNNMENKARILACIGRDMPAPEIAALVGVSLTHVHQVAYRHRRGVRNA